METLVKQESGSLIDNLCRKLLFSILQTMDDGYIKVYDQKGEFEFGNPNAELQVTFEVDHEGIDHPKFGLESLDDIDRGGVIF